jgi:hypothetical protein
MSLVAMDCSRPSKGVKVTSSSQKDTGTTMHWGLSGGITNNIFNTTTALTYSINTIPYQINSASTACTLGGSTDGVLWPYKGTTSDASTEYSNNGSYVTATSGKAACDFNGIRNTAACYVKTKDSSQWTASTVEDNTTDAPAAVCAGRFKTVGTKSFLDVYKGITSNNLKYGTPTSTKVNKGFWYLPALGELCYIPRFRFEINKTILALNQKYGNVGVQLVTTNFYWSSSEHSISYTWDMHMNFGHIDNYYKYSNFYVRAFMRW